MSSNRSGDQWAFSPSLNARYRTDAQRNVYVLEDGREIPIPATPRTTAGVANPTQAYQQYPSLANAVYTAGAPRPNVGSSELPQRVVSLSLGAEEPTSVGQQRPRAGREADFRQGASQPIVKARDPATQVSTVVQKAPAQVITDPTLYDVGVDAHRRLLPTTGDEEAFDPGKSY